MSECTLCHEGVYQEKLVVFSSRRADRLVIVEDVPAMVCDICGDRIITDETALEIERVAAGEPHYSGPIHRFPRKVA